MQSTLFTTLTANEEASLSGGSWKNWKKKDDKKKKIVLPSIINQVAVNVAVAGEGSTIDQLALNIAEAGKGAKISQAAVNVAVAK